MTNAERDCKRIQRETKWCRLCERAHTANDAAHKRLVELLSD